MSESTLRAEIISIGDEMTSGARLDTNSQWLSRRLGELGIEVEFHSTVGDTLQHNIDVFRIAAGRADIVVATGGLGPTRDDLTRQALAAAANEPLEFRQSALDHIESLFSKRNREMPERNKIQAMFPVSSDEVFNPQGTAPGIDVVLTENDNRCRVFALPGVPAEMMRMFDDTVAPRIMAMAGGQANHIEHFVMKFFGTGESDMEQRLGDMIERDRTPRVGITVSAATISLRITAIDRSKDACLAQIESTRQEILSRVGDLHYGDGEDYEQFHAVDSELQQRGESVVTVEFGYAAQLADWFATLGPTPSHRGGMTFAELSDLASFLGVTPDAALEQLRHQSSADWLLAVDQYPSLEGSNEAPLPAADVELIVLSPTGERFSTTSRIGGHPSIIQPRIAKAALAWFRHLLRENTDTVSATDKAAR
ncbi:competence/damage-inducible protein A [Rhodopirellula sp. MGV]|uniref:competence/damage-inducible protein A n=1 Tax=Rhodopirellula sp. MGV TaxID=2023130 RepID=UPI000B964220|nr:molybdopterin-binding protein [Rhodopirellula sp. MGV]OYP28360.1 competence/damage-inducible protein A [Rhodopirellula sp. MGV]PNY38764.1 competence/damage-inducible protein A [Rhodopirellula baltica]